MTLSLVFLFSIVGLCVDLGWGYYRKQAAQTAADAAALAGSSYAMGLTPCGTSAPCSTSSCASLSTASALYSACQYAAANGFTDGSGNATVSVTGGTGTPTNGPANSTNYWVQANVSQSLPELFLGFAGFHTATVSARSISGVIGYTSGPPYCIHTLNSSNSNAFFMSGSNSSLTLSGCSMYVNSNSSQALVVNGSASLTNTGGSNIAVVGTANINGASCPSGYTCSAASVSDPLASLAAPTFSGCDVTNGNYTSGSTTINPSNKSVYVFCGTGGSSAITISAATVSFNPGIYIINGGGININSTSVVTGSGVMFYNTATSGKTISGITISGQPNVTLSAPTSGAYRGILFFQDRSTSYSSGNNFNGGSTLALNGTLYFPGSNVTFSGTAAGAASYTAIIAQDLTINGGANFKWDSSGVYTGLASLPYLMQ